MFIPIFNPSISPNIVALQRLTNGRLWILFRTPEILYVSATYIYVSIQPNTSRVIKHIFLLIPITPLIILDSRENRQEAGEPTPPYPIQVVLVYSMVQDLHMHMLSLVP